MNTGIVQIIFQAVQQIITIEYLQNFINGAEWTLEKAKILFKRLIIAISTSNFQSDYFFFKVLWDIDWAYDGRRYFSSNMLTSQYIDTYINLRHQRSVRTRGYERVAVNEVQGMLRADKIFVAQQQDFEVELNDENELFRETEKFVKLYRYMMNSDDNEISLDNSIVTYSRDYQELLQKYFPNKNNLPQLYNNSVQQGYRRLTLSLQALLALNKVSDSEYMKSIFIMEVIEKVIAGAGLTSIWQLAREKFEYPNFIIYIARVMNTGMRMHEKRYEDLYFYEKMSRDGAKGIEVDNTLTQQLAYKINFDQRAYKLRIQGGAFDTTPLIAQPNDQIGQIKTNALNPINIKVAEFANDELTDFIQRVGGGVRGSSLRFRRKNLDVVLKSILEDPNYTSNCFDIIAHLILQSQILRTPNIEEILNPAKKGKRIDHHVSVVLFSRNATNNIDLFLRNIITRIGDEHSNNPTFFQKKEMVQYYTFNITIQQQKQMQLAEMSALVRQLIYKEILIYLQEYGSDGDYANQQESLQQLLHRKYTLGLAMGDCVISDVRINSRFSFEIKSEPKNNDQLKKLYDMYEQYENASNSALLDDEQSRLETFNAQFDLEAFDILEDYTKLIQNAEQERNRLKRMDQMPEAHYKLSAQNEITTEKKSKKLQKEEKLQKSQNMKKIKVDFDDDVKQAILNYEKENDDDDEADDEEEMDEAALVQIYKNSRRLRAQYNLENFKRGRRIYRNGQTYIVSYIRNNQGRRLEVERPEDYYENLASTLSDDDEEQEEEEEVDEEISQIHKNSLKKRLKKNSVMTPRDKLFEKLFPPMSEYSDSTNHNCIDVTINILTKLAGLEASPYDTKEQAEIIIQNLSKQIKPKLFFLNYTSGDVVFQLYKIIKQINSIQNKAFGELILFTSNTHSFIHKVECENIPHLKEIDFALLKNVLFYDFSFKEVDQCTDENDFYLIYTKVNHLQKIKSGADQDYYPCETDFKQNKNKQKVYVKTNAELAAEYAFEQIFEQIRTSKSNINKTLIILHCLCKFKKTKVNQKRIYARKNFLALALGDIQIDAKDKTKISEAMIAIKKFEISCYFDFETTCVADYVHQYKDLRQTENTIQTRKQIDFMCAAIYKVNMPLLDIYQGLMNDIDNFLISNEIGSYMKGKKRKSFAETIQTIMSIQLDGIGQMQSCYESEQIFEGIPSAKAFMESNQQLMSDIEKNMSKYKSILIRVKKEISEYLQKNEKSDRDSYARVRICTFITRCIDIDCQMYLYSYNGAKFDNQFILGYMKTFFKDDWTSRISYVGTLNDLKVLVIDRKFIFQDLRLMTAGGSLASMCKAFKINADKAKISFDMKKMATFESVMEPETYEEIKNYVMHDVTAIAELHKIFRECIAQIVVKRLGELNVFEEQEEEEEQQEFNIFGGDKKEKKAKKQKFLSYDVVLECTRLNTKNWITMSSLASRIFQNYFNIKYDLEGPSSNEIHQFMQTSYQGGYTQNFGIGAEKSNGIFYLDFNSMYPALMAKLKFPVNLAAFSWRVLYYKTQVLTRKKWFELSQWNSSPKENDYFNPLRSSIPLSVLKSDYNLFLITKFKFKDDCMAPMFGVRTKKHGTIYPLQYDAAKEKEIIGDELVLFGFQISQAFALDILESVEYEKELVYNLPKQINQKSSGVFAAEYEIFKTFINTFYEDRLKYKKEKNDAMAQSLKIIMNSTYGKFGEKQHPIRFVMKNDEFQNDEIFEQKVYDQLDRCKYCDLQQYLLKKKESQVTDEIKVKEFLDITHNTMNDIDPDAVEVTVKGFPTKPNHLGAMVYYASLITAIGRTHILYLINQIFINKGRVLYADTDSLIIDNCGYQYLQKSKIVELDGEKLGAMKNEYPLNGDQQQSDIILLNVLNKKIYQYQKKSDNKMVNKFKGCTNPPNDFFDNFKQNALFSNIQQRFKNEKGGVIIADTMLNYVLRLSRNLSNTCNPNQLQYLEPFINVTQHSQFYDQKDYIVSFNQVENLWQYQQKQNTNNQQQQ